VWIARSERFRGEIAVVSYHGFSVLMSALDRAPAPDSVPHPINVLGILQARVSSSRLPGKVLKPILGRPMLLHQLDRVRRARSLDALVVATSSDASDDAVEALCASAGVACFRGSLEDVLDRFYRAALEFNPQHIVRLTGDCPLIDPELIDRVVEFYLAGGFDDVGNAVEPTFPDGLDVEVLGFAILEQAWKHASLRSHREHVTLFVHASPDRFRVGSYKQSIDLSHLRWTVDEPEDFELVEQIYEALYPENPAFTTDDILDLLARRPDLTELNSGIRRNEGLERSLARDAERAP
jgi:spore coat polysaccharide biosynthesis protein SpsF